VSDPKTHGELVKAGLRDECDLRGLISESHNCIDCGYNTNPGCDTREEAEQSMRAAKKAGPLDQWRVPQRYDSRSEVYIVHRHVWKKAGMKEYGGCLCIGCLEKRIGRKLEPYDFPPDHPFNDTSLLPGTRRRFERLTGAETLEGLEDQPEPPQASKLDLAFQKTFGKQWRAA
jgi:hypothetical protein